jgi:hypothetical protein
MSNLPGIIIIIVLVLSFFLHYESNYSDLIYAKSTVDNKNYLVRNRDDRVEAANMLSLIKTNLIKIVEHLKENNMSDPRVKRLVSKFQPSNISESLPNTNYTSYSVNKGEKIVFCIRAKDEKESLEDINTMMFVAIHELAHIMTISVGHTDEFWDNMKYLLEKGIKIGVYSQEDYKSKPREYCGVKITDSPLEYKK